MESKLIDWLRERLPSHPQLRLGPGDDAAILQWSHGNDCVVTSDLLTDGVDFHLDQCDATSIGRKSLAVNLSDLAAMAAKPTAVVVSLALPRFGGLELAKQLYEGMLPLAEQFDVPIAGGDTNSWSGSLVISITALGQVTRHGPLLRGGGKVGDSILVTGSFGGSILGKHFNFVPRVQEALQLNADYKLHGAIDVSDGLSLDLDRLARESGCGAVIDLDAVPIDPAAKELAEKEAQQSQSGLSALEHALSDGEDFELILVVGSEEAGRLLDDQPLEVPLTRIGELIEQKGLWNISPEGELVALKPEGYQHRFE